VREIVGAPTATRRRLTNALAYAGRAESTVLLEEPETSTRSCYRRRKPRRRPRQRRYGLGSPCSRVGRGWAMGLLVMRWCGIMPNRGWASKLTWATARGPMMQSAPLSQGAGDRIEETDDS